MAFSLPEGFGTALLDFFYQWAQKSLAMNKPPTEIKEQIKNPNELNGTRLELFTRRQLGLQGWRNRGQWKAVKDEAMAAVRDLRMQVTDADADLMIQNCMDSEPSPLIGDSPQMFTGEEEHNVITDTVDAFLKGGSSQFIEYIKLCERYGIALRKAVQAWIDNAWPTNEPAPPAEVQRALAKVLSS